MRVCAVPILYVYRIYMLNGRTRAKNPQQQEDKNEVDFVSRQMSHIELMHKKKYLHCVIDVNFHWGHDC